MIHPVHAVQIGYPNTEEEAKEDRYYYISIWAQTEESIDQRSGVLMAPLCLFTQLGEADYQAHQKGEVTPRIWAVESLHETKAKTARQKVVTLVIKVPMAPKASAN